MSLVIPGTSAPSNLHLPSDAKAQVIDADLYGICDRIKEVSPSLYITLLSRGSEYSYVIVEQCDDGVDRQVFKVKELDGRVVERLKYLMAKPLNERMVELEAEEKRRNKQAEEERSEEFYENMGLPMRHELAKAGFTGKREHYRKRYDRRNG